MSSTAPQIALDPEIVDWIETVAQRGVAGAVRIPGGGTREGWFVDLTGAEDDAGALFLRYSPHELPANTAFHRLATEAAVVRALRNTDVPVPRIIAIHPQREAVLMERINGETWFSRIADPDQRLATAKDFVRCLAAQHRLDPRRLDLSILGAVKSAEEHAIDRIAAIRARGTAGDGSIDPLLRVTLDWLEANVPDYDGPVVLVQGDTGPGNFMHRDGEVQAVLDWELCHFGDPMDDIAWLSLRTVQDTFTHLPDRLREYEALSGHTIDGGRVWYYRVFAEATMTTLNGPHDDTGSEIATRDLGNAIVYKQLHRRLWIEALNEAMHLGLQPPAIPDAVETHDWHRWYEGMLVSLKTIAPRVQVPLAAQWTRGIARVVKFLAQVDLSGREFAELERAEIADLLGTQPATLEEARTQLTDRPDRGGIDDADYVRLAWNAVFRNDHLMRTASGVAHPHLATPGLTSTGPRARCSRERFRRVSVPAGFSRAITSTYRYSLAQTHRRL